MDCIGYNYARRISWNTLKIGVIDTMTAVNSREMKGKI